MTKRFFTSDLHIGHKLVAGLRGFETDHPQTGEFGLSVAVPDTAAHDAHIAENWDRVVGPDDTVFVLGDISINPKRDGAFEWIRNRPGIKHLISGNHDETHNAHSKSLQAQQDPLWRDTFATINDWTRLKMHGRTVLLSHFPYEGEGGRANISERFPEYRLRDGGHPLLHGHTHENSQYRISEAGSHQLHVGLDAWGLQLVPEATIIEWLSFLS